VHALDPVRGEPWLAGVDVRPAGREELARIAGTGDHQGVVAIADPYPDVALADVAGAPGPIVMLDGAHDPRNIGAVARVVEAAGGSGIVIPSRGGPGITPVVCKASAGAVEHLRIARVESTVGALHELRAAGRPTLGADPGGRDYRGHPPDPALVLVVGAEGAGLRPRLASACDALTAIPMRGRVGSLNLSVATGILLFGLAVPAQSLD